MNRVIKRIWSQASPGTFAVAQSIHSRRNIEQSCIRDGRFELAEKVAAAVGYKVHSGPFQGMALNPALFKQHMSPKLLGTYEDELHAFLFSTKEINVDHVINIGSAEGYYSVGACLLWKHAIVDAFELDRKSRRVTGEHGRLNHVNDRLRVNGRAEPGTIEKHLGKSSLPVIISDCEGFEVELLDPNRAPSLRKSIVICEMHPAKVPQIETILTSRFNASHKVQVVIPRRKLASDYSGYFNSLSLNHAEQEVAVNEYRGFTPWFLAMPIGCVSSDKV